MPDLNYPKVKFEPELDVRPWSDCGGDPNCDNPDCIRRCAATKKAEWLREQLSKPFDEAAEKERIFKKEQKRMRREESKRGWIR